MLGVGGLPPPSAPPLALKRATTTNSIFVSLLFQSQTHKAQLSLLQNPLHNFSPLLLGRTGLCLFAQKKKQDLSFVGIELLKKKGGFVEEEEEEEFEFDEDGDVDDDFGDENEDFDEDEGDVVIPYHKMDEWLVKKPRGFGEGKVYDTSIEDKLLAEIEKAKEAQLANIKKLKNETKEPTSKGEPKKELNASEGVPSGIRVRISNLPKKKNIQRDLKSAFQGVPGILNISPAVSGNKKTREPVCKGFGFVDFKSFEDANRFVQMFSRQSITFGKAEKLIKCEILKPQEADNEGLASNGYNSTSKSMVAVLEDESDQDLDTEQNDLMLQFGEDDDYDESDEEPDSLDIVENFELASSPEQGDSDGEELKMKSTTDPSPKHEKKTKATKKKSAVKKKPEKLPKLNIPGSAKKLKVREKAKLAEVFSRYGSKEALASKEL